MLPEVATVSGIIKTAYELGKEILEDAKKKADSSLTERLNRLLFLISDLNFRIMELQNVVLETKERLSALEKENAELKSEIEASRQWEIEKGQYELAEITTGVFAYRFKDGKHHTVWFCPNCFEKRFKSILQLIRGEDGRFYRYCFECSFKVPAEPPSSASPKTAELRPRGF